jgi:hypothetical protein
MQSQMKRTLHQTRRQMLTLTRQAPTCCLSDFSPYKEFKLPPIEDVELPEPSYDQPANNMELHIYKMMVTDDWRMQEGRDPLCACRVW